MKLKQVHSSNSDAWKKIGIAAVLIVAAFGFLLFLEGKMTGMAGKTPSETICTEALCKSDSSCIGKKIEISSEGAAEYCVWSAIDGKPKTAKKERRGLSVDKTFCIDINKKVYSLGSLHAGYLCGKNNAWLSCKKEGEVFESYICNGVKWVDCDQHGLIVGKNACDNKGSTWTACGSSNKNEIFGKSGCNGKEWTVCDVKQKDKSTGKYICDGKKWINKNLETAPSVVSVDLPNANKDWLHLGDDEIPDFHQPIATLASKTDIKAKLPYLIGEELELFFQVDDVSTSSNYDTEVELNNKKAWPIDSLKKNIKAEKICLCFENDFTGTEYCSKDGWEADGGSWGWDSFYSCIKLKDADGSALTWFKAKDGKISANNDSTIKFNLGVEGNNYDDIEIKNMYLKTGIISSVRSYFGETGLVKYKSSSGSTVITTNKIKPLWEFKFNSGTTFLPGDEIKLRFFVYGLVKPTPSDIKNNQWITKITLNGQKYNLNEKMPSDYKEESFENGCTVRFPDDLTIVNVPIKYSDIKNGINSLVITSGTKKTGSKTAVDNFFIDRVELVVNEENVPGQAYSVKTASKNWEMIDCG